MGQLRFRRIAVKRSGVIERAAHAGLLAFRTNERVHQGAQPIQRRLARIFQDGLQQVVRLPPFVRLQPEQDGGLVGEVLIERADGDTGFLGDARGGETLRALFRQNLSCRLQDGFDELAGADLFGLLSQ